MKKRASRKHPVRSLAEWKGLHLPGHPPKILLDQELRAFLDEALTRMTFKEAAAACLERFGARRAVGAATIHRYWQEQQKLRGRR